MTAAKRVGTTTRKRKPPASVVDRMVAAGLPAPEQVEPKGPYPKNVRVFAYQPKDGSEPILLALNGFEKPTKVWLFDLSQQPVLSQTWAWMRKANVPKDIQRRANLLEDAEYFDMFDQWFAAMTANNAPKGAVTAGK